MKKQVDSRLIEFLARWHKKPGDKMLSGHEVLEFHLLTAPWPKCRCRICNKKRKQHRNLD